MNDLFARSILPHPVGPSLYGPLICSGAFSEPPQAVRLVMRQTISSCGACHFASPLRQRERVRRKLGERALVLAYGSLSHLALQ